MKLKTLLLPLTAFALCANAFAATPSDASLERLFEVQKMDALLDQSFQKVGSIMLADPNIQNFLRDAPVEKRPQLEAVLKNHANRIVAEINTPQVRAQLRKAALDGTKTVLTQEEVNALIGFYSTAVGQSILDKMPRYLEATMNPAAPESIRRIRSCFEFLFAQRSRFVFQHIGNAVFNRICQLRLTAPQFLFVLMIFQPAFGNGADEDV